MDLPNLLEAGLQLNASVHHVADVASVLVSNASDSINNLMPSAGIDSDCCGSNNYPPEPAPTIPEA